MARDVRFIVLERATPAAVRAAAAELSDDAQRVVPGWRPAVSPGAGPVVCVGKVRSEDEAAGAVLAAVSGANLVVDADAAREVIDQLCDDLRRIGELDHRVDPHAGPQLSPEQRALLAKLLTGATLGEAARSLHISRRTADRRLAAARGLLGVETTSAALRVAAELRLVRPGS